MIVCLRRTTYMELITSATQGLQSFAKRVQNKTKHTFFLIYEWLVIVHFELACIDNIAILLLLLS